MGNQHDPKGALGDCESRGLTSRYSKIGPARSAANLCTALPPCRRRTGPDSISAGARLDPDNRAVLGLQAEASLRRQRQDGNRTLRNNAWSKGRVTRPLRQGRVLFMARDAVPGCQTRLKPQVALLASTVIAPPRTIGCNRNGTTLKASAGSSEDPACLSSRADRTD
jgi:hypothetical protein